jgi:FkbM family methyltransferase
MIKEIVKKFINTLGYQIKKIDYQDDPNFLLSKVLEKYDVRCFFDIGANIGQTAISLFKNNFKGKIVSFEPQLHEYNILKKNSQKYKNWEVFERCGIGEKNGFKILNVSNNSLSSSFLNFDKTTKEISNKIKYIGKAKVRVFTLKTVFQKYQKENNNFFLKIDAQGFEKKILYSSKNILKKFIGISCELPIKRLYKKEENYLDVIKFLKKYNFEVYTVFNSVYDIKKGKTFALDITFINKNFFK